MPNKLSLLEMTLLPILRDCSPEESSVMEYWLGRHQGAWEETDFARVSQVFGQALQTGTDSHPALAKLNCLSEVTALDKQVDPEMRALSLSMLGLERRERFSPVFGKPRYAARPYEIQWVEFLRNFPHLYDNSIEEVPMLISRVPREGQSAPEFRLAAGIFLSYFDSLFHPQRQQRLNAFPNVMEAVAQGFGSSSVELFTIDIASKLRDSFGHDESARALKAGIVVARGETDLIRSDYILDIWTNIDRRAWCNYHYCFTEIHDAFGRLSFPRLMPDALEMLVYAEFCAIVYLRLEAQLNRFMETYVYKYIVNRHLKNRVKAQLEANQWDVRNVLLSEASHA